MRNNYMFVFSYQRLIRNSAFKSVDYMIDTYLNACFNKKDLFKKMKQGYTYIILLKRFQYNLKNIFN